MEIATDIRAAETRKNVVRSAQHEHAALREQLRALEREIDSARVFDGAAIAARLQALRSAVSQHFQSEEHDGLFDTLAKDEPRLNRSVRRLIAEHREMEQSLDVLISSARMSPAVDNGFKQNLHNWIHRLRRHEIDEEDLISAATKRDLGTATKGNSSRRLSCHSAINPLRKRAVWPKQFHLATLHSNDLTLRFAAGSTTTRFH